MSNQTIDFYNKESSSYSAKRYPQKPAGYSHYLFRTRGNLLLHFLRKKIKDLPKSPNILDIGCADGVMFRTLEEKFHGYFGELIGMDISPMMIEEARRLNGNPRASFYLRESLPEKKFDIVTELGVHPHDLAAELAYVDIRLKPGGFFFYTLASSNSTYVRFKLKNASYTKDYKKYEEYESEVSKRFNIEDSRAYAVFIPKLWAWPSLARIMQPAIDKILQHVVPDLFHEKIYVLRSKTK